MGNAKFILGIEIVRGLQPGQIGLIQTKFIKKALQDVGEISSNPVTIPITGGDVGDRDQNSPEFEDKTKSIMKYNLKYSLLAFGLLFFLLGEFLMAGFVCADLTIDIDTCTRARRLPIMAKSVFIIVLWCSGLWLLLRERKKQ